MKTYKGVTAKTYPGKWDFDFVTDGTTRYAVFKVGEHTLRNVDITDALIRDTKSEGQITMLIRQCLSKKLVVGVKVGGKKVKITNVMLRVMVFEVMLLLVLMLALLWTTGIIFLALSPFLFFGLFQVVSVIKFLRF